MKHFFFLRIKQKINLFLTLSHFNELERFSHCFERYKDNNKKKVSSKKIFEIAHSC